jgi:hypothetical protein
LNFELLFRFKKNYSDFLKKKKKEKNADGPARLGGSLRAALASAPQKAEARSAP